MNIYDNSDEMKKMNVIAIDGPAASGKTSVGKSLAEQLGFAFLDTGIMYRAVTWSVMNNQVDPSDENAVTNIANNISIEIKKPSVKDGRDNDVIVDSHDVTWKIREKNVADNVSLVSSYSGVRNAMTRLQREIATKGKIVMVGRDIGTVVLPGADLKIYLWASVDIRAQRRYHEELLRGKNVDYTQILENVKFRDRLDSTREIAPLKIANGAIQICTDNKTIDEVVRGILRHIDS